MVARRSILDAPNTERVGRYPKHTFRVNSLPFTAQPFCLARVMPGDSLKSLWFESRVVTDPVLNPIIGWKKEYFFFYVKITDLLLEEMKEMFVDPANRSIDTITTYELANNVQRTYAAKGGIDWTDRALTRIVDTWFRDEGDPTSAHVTSTTMPGTPIVQIREATWMDSVTDSDDMDALEGGDISSATDMGDLNRLLMAYENLMGMGVSNMSYEDWLRANGVPIPQKDENKPELLCQFSDFQYPANTINPANGAPTSALSWVFKNGSKEKPKFFKEPGFIVGISVTRPKIYFGGLAGSLACHAMRAWDWVPNYMADMPISSWREFATDTGPLGDRTSAKAAYFIDMRDDMIHGDQFQNVVAFDAAVAGSASNHLLALPANDLTGSFWKYPTEAMTKSFFVDAAGTAFYVKQDGYVSLNIQGKLVDTSVGALADQ